MRLTLLLVFCRHTIVFWVLFAQLLCQEPSFLVQGFFSAPDKARRHTEVIILLHGVNITV